MTNKAAASRGKQNTNVRQRKKPSQQKTDKNSSDNDDDQLLDEAIKSSGKNVTVKFLPVLLAGLFVAAIVALASAFGGGNATTDNKEQGVSSAASKTNEQQRREEEIPMTKIVTDYKILRTLPHDPKAFTQGLTFRPDNSSILYEATGMYNESELRILNLQNSNGDVLQRFQTPEQYFGEGLSYFPVSNNETENNDKDETSTPNGRLIHITWREQTGFIFDIDSLEVLEEFTYSTTTDEGWGIIHVPNTYDELDTKFIVSDGSAYLHFWGDKYQETKPKVEVTYRTSEMAERDLPPQAVKLLNELEWDDSTQTVLANVWFQDMIVRIDPQTGFVTTIYDLRSLYTDRLAGADVFNGIAINADGDIWVTGKYWPHLYQIELGES